MRNCASYIAFAFACDFAAPSWPFHSFPIAAITPDIAIFSVIIALIIVEINPTNTISDGAADAIDEPNAKRPPALAPTTPASATSPVCR